MINSTKTGTPTGKPHGGGAGNGMGAGTDKVPAAETGPRATTPTKGKTQIPAPPGHPVMGMGVQAGVVPYTR